jgi:putative endonuclease
LVLRASGGCPKNLLREGPKNLLGFEPSMAWYVYIIRCRDKTLYTGVTNNLKRRIHEHNYGRGCRYTKYRWPVRLIHSEEYSAKPAALSREAGIKRLPRKKKLTLIKK